MAHRTITDLLGTEWQVWATRPGPRSRVSEGLRGGWLTFECAPPSAAKRRLVPIVAGWDELPEHELLGLLAQARPVSGSRRTTAVTLEESSAPPQARLP